MTANAPAGTAFLTEATGAPLLTTRAVTAATTVAANEFVVADATSTAYTVTGPAAGTSRRWGVKKSDSTANLVTISYVNAAGGTTTIGLVATDDAKTFEAIGSGYVAIATDRARTVDDLRYAKRNASPLTIAALGDSQTANDNAVPDILSVVGSTTNSSWQQLACVQSGESLRYGGNFGVPGENSTAILARVGTVINASPKPDGCVVTAGRNDLGGATPTTLVQVDLICKQLIAAGIEPVLGTIPPDNATSNATLMLQLRSVNQQVRNYARANGLRLIDFYQALVDPVSGGYRTGQFKDTTHPNEIGLAFMATAALAVLKPVGSGSTLYRRRDNTLLGAELVTNGLMIGGASGVPTGWTQLSATGGTPALITNDTDFTNSTCWELVATSATSPGYLMQQVVGLTIGDTYEFSFRDKVTGQAVGNGQPSVQLTYADNTIIHWWREQADHVAGTQTFRFVATQNTLRINLYFQNGAVTTTVTWHIGEISCRDLTTLGAVAA